MYYSDNVELDKFRKALKRRYKLPYIEEVGLFILLYAFVAVLSIFRLIQVGY